MRNFTALFTGVFQALFDPFRPKKDRGYDSKPFPMKRTLAEIVAEVALEEEGVREQGGNNKGPHLQKYFDADNYKPNAQDNGYAWCAAFVCWVVYEAMRRLDLPETVGFKRPKTPGAWDFERWSLQQDSTTWLKKPSGRDIKRGDIVVFNMSHIGVAVSGPDENGYLWTVEGNTSYSGSRDGGGTFRKKRHYTQFRSRIRFTI